MTAIKAFALLAVGLGVLVGGFMLVGSIIEWLL